MLLLISLSLFFYRIVSLEVIKKISLTDKNFGSKFQKK